MSLMPLLANAATTVGSMALERALTGTPSSKRTKFKRERGSTFVRVEAPNAPNPVTGTIGSRIPRARLVRASSGGRFAKYGSTGMDEVYDVTDQNQSAYFGVCSMKCPSAYHPVAQSGGSETAYATHSVSGDVYYHVCAALLRDICRREFGMEVLSHDDFIGTSTNSAYGGTSLYNHPGFRLNFVYKATAVGDYPAFMIGTPLYTRMAVAGGVAEPKKFRFMVREIASQFAGELSYTDDRITDKILYGYYITTPDVNTATGETIGRVGPLKRLDTRKVTCYSNCEVMVQNTTSADGTTGDPNNVTRTDANPLVGHVLSFRDIQPKARSSVVNASVTSVAPGFTIAPNAVILANPSNHQERFTWDTNLDGVMWPGTNPTEEFAEQLLVPQQFSNFTGMTKFGLGPGEIRKYNMSFKFNGTLNKFFRGINLLTFTGSGTSGTLPARLALPGTHGTCVVFGFTPPMNVKGVTKTIAVNVNVTYRAGAVLERPVKDAVLPMMNDRSSTYKTIANDKSAIV